jgi:hypothetical protein
VYLLRHGRLRQLTKDHSLVQSQLDRGMLTPEEAKHHPGKTFSCASWEPTRRWHAISCKGLCSATIFFYCVRMD